MKQIRVSDRDNEGLIYPEDTVLEALQHEILHFINDIYDNDRLQENDIDSMSEGLYQVLSDNG